MKEHIELKKAIVERIDPDILITKYRANTEITLEDAEEIDNAHTTMSQGGEMFIIADVTAGNSHVAKDAEDFFVHKGRMIPYTKGIALVTNHKSPLLARLFGASTKTLYPTKEFTSIEDAKKWFDSLRE